MFKKYWLVNEFMPSGVTHILFSFCSLRYNFNSCLELLLRSVW
jgi:hypothetical protein